MMFDFDLVGALTEAERRNLGPAGMAVLRAEMERARLDEVRDRGAVAECFGTEIPEAPARGPVKAVDFVRVYPRGADDWEVKPAGFQGRRTMQVVDAFDVMEARARKRLFTDGQKAVGRAYGALFERHAAAGMRCTSIETRTDRTTTGGGEFIDAVLQDARQLALWERRVGRGVALEVRRVRPGSAARSVLPDLHLVRAVCVAGQTISKVLDAGGWPKNGRMVEAARMALCAALDRMAGPQVRHGIKVMRTDGAGVVR